jgi:hypothetical protein
MILSGLTGYKFQIRPDPRFHKTGFKNSSIRILCPARYRKNEVFLDVIESVNLLAGASGNVLRSEIVGAIKMRVYLSGMPELRLGLNDKVGTVLESRVSASSNSNSSKI